MKRATLDNPCSMTRSLVALLIAVAAAVDSGFAQQAGGSEAGARQTMEAMEAGVAIRVTIAVDRTELTVADRVVLTISMDVPPGVMVQLPKLDEFAGFTHVSTTESTGGSVAASGVTREYRVVLEPFLAGEKTIPVLEITAQVPASGVITNGRKAGPTTIALKSQPMTIVVRAIAPKDADANTPLKSAPVVLPGSVPESETQKLILMIAAGTGIGTAIAGGVIMSRRRTGRAVSPLQAALRELELIAGRSSTARISPEVAAEIARVVRAYCVDGLMLASPGASNAELASTLREASSIPDATGAEVAALLGQLDVLAFAPAASQSLDDPTSAEFIERARAWILSCPSADHTGGGAA